MTSTSASRRNSHACACCLGVDLPAWFAPFRFHETSCIPWHYLIRRRVLSNSLSLEALPAPGAWLLPRRRSSGSDYQGRRLVEQINYIDPQSARNLDQALDRQTYLSKFDAP